MVVNTGEGYPRRGELWPTPGGWLDASEHQRFFVLEVARESYFRGKVA
jgi:hypothetical protein